MATPTKNLLLRPWVLGVGVMGQLLSLLLCASMLFDVFLMGGLPGLGWQGWAGAGLGLSGGLELWGVFNGQT